MSSKNKQVFVAKLPKDVTQEELREMFTPYGEIENISLKHGFAFIVGVIDKNYADENAVQSAIDACHGQTLRSNELVVEKAQEGKRRRNPNGPQPDDECRACRGKGHWYPTN